MKSSNVRGETNKNFILHCDSRSHSDCGLNKNIASVNNPSYSTNINKLQKPKLKLAKDNFTLKNSENFVPPCQYTFLTAVKRKLNLSDELKADQKSLNKNFKSVQDPLIEPNFSLKKDSAKGTEMSSRSSSDRVHRKLDFSNVTSGPSTTAVTVNSENIEPLKIPGYSVSKKKGDRDQKENIVKRLRKDKGDIRLVSKKQNTELSQQNKRILRRNEIDKKSQDKNFAASIFILRNEEQRKPSKSKKEKVIDLRNRSSSSDSLSVDTRKKLHEKILIREGYKAMLSEASEQRRKREDELKCKIQKNQKIKEPIKKSSSSSIKTETRSTPQMSEEITAGIVYEHSNSKSHTSSAISEIKSKESEFIESELKYSDSFVQSSNNSLEINPLPERLLDSRRISFRDDNYHLQPEFCELKTPDMNLTLRSRRKKQEKEFSQESHSVMHKNEGEQENFFDPYKQSLRQVLEIENCKSKLSIEDIKKPSHFSDSTKIESEPQTTASTFMSNNIKNLYKTNFKVAEVQTQTAIDIATQTDNNYSSLYGIEFKKNVKEVASSSSGISDANDISQVSLNSADRYESMDQVEDMSLTNKMRAMSEISLHETTSSIKTETGTEISISTRGLTCSFNKHLHLQMAQMVKDERQRYDKIEMLYKSHKKSLHDKTRKIAELQEQKKALRNKGLDDSRISSLKKKQRALVLEVAQEAEEIDRLKELHEIASKERKLMLQKQRDMFNPDMSTTNIRNKLKRSAESQSPRRLSGPMRGYDIRSNSSMSSLFDSDKSQIESKLNLPSLADKKSNQVSSKADLSTEGIRSKLDNADHDHRIQREHVKSKGDVGLHKYEDKMPRSSINKKINLHELLSNSAVDAFSSEDEKSESDAMMEEISKLWQKRPFIDTSSLNLDSSELLLNKLGSGGPYVRSGKKQRLLDIKNEKSKVTKAHQTNFYQHKKSKVDIDQSDGSLYSSIFEELESNGSQNSLQALLKHSNLVNEKNCMLLQDIVGERTATQLQRKYDPLNGFESPKTIENAQNKSQLSLRVSQHSSNESEKSFSRSVVIDNHSPGLKNSRKLEQILNAREATLVSRKRCVEDWISWHARLREEENRVARMEQAAYKLVSASAKSLPHNDTTVSSDTSDIESRIEVLTQKLADRRLEMTRLKKEARKQAKKRLKSLETNLLNQIQKYDATIDEMRKKIELRKVYSRENRRQAIEPKNVVDFKVPELPIKKIQEIYKSSDLLRSKTESALVVSDSIKNNFSDKSRDINSEIETISVSSRFPVNSDSTSNEIETEKSDSSCTVQLNKQNSKSNDKNVLESLILQIKEQKRSPSQSSDISEDISSDPKPLNKQKTENGEIISLSKCEEEAEKDVTVKTTSSNIQEDVTASSDNTSLVFSKKLDYIQLHNKELSDDIRHLENDLKELSELMSNLSQKTEEKISKSSNNVKSLVDFVITSNKDDFSSEPKETATNEALEADELYTAIDESEIKAKSEQILNEIERSMITEVSKTIDASANINSDLFEKEFETNTKTVSVVKSKAQNSYSDGFGMDEISEAEVPSINQNSYSNEFSKEDISEECNSPENNNYDLLELKNDIFIPNDINLENRSDSLNSKRTSPENGTSFHINNSKSAISEMLEGDVKVEDKGQFDNQKAENDKGSIMEELGNLIEINVDDIGKDIESTSKLENSENKWTYAHPVDSVEPSEVEKRNLNFENESFTNDNEVHITAEVIDDSAMFIPRGESTNISTFVLKLESTLDSTGSNIGICSEEFNDILEIIERETKIDDENSKALSYNVDNTITESKAEVPKENSQILAFAKTNKNEEQISFENFKNTGSFHLAEEEINENNNRNISNNIYEQFNENKVISNGEQLDNYIEEEERRIETVEKQIANNINICLNKTFEIIKDPDYEDISEESLEVSEILDKNKLDSESKKTQKMAKMPEKYVVNSQSDEVLKILDEISVKSNNIIQPPESSLTNGSIYKKEPEQIVKDDSKELKNEIDILEIIQENSANGLSENQENLSCTSNEALDTPRGVSEIEFDSPRDPNQSELSISRLDVDDLDDDLLSNKTDLNKKSEVKTELCENSSKAASEKDIEAMIDKLKASLPGLEVAEVEAKLLRIEQLQIELEIKKLEAEEVSYYVREIPNKPPPPYTPPGTGILSTAQSSPSPPPAIIPSNIEELTVITDKASEIIFKAKQDSKDVNELEAPQEICELVKDNEELRKDRKIYNTFLFDLCKEIISEVYRTDDEKVGPSWTKPSVKTKPIIKVPKNVEELSEYVSKEVATLFGFKTKLQRENMVMRWSRKRRDRVDELLAREAQAEEKEWTKFHYDELAVKGELTLTILDSLIMETTNVLKNVYAKKRRLAV